MPTPYDNTNSGFSLLEVLVALSMLSISLASLMELYSGLAGVSDRARVHMRALEIAERNMEEFIHSGIVQDGIRFDYEEAGYHVEMQASLRPKEYGQGAVAAYEVTVNVRRNGPVHPVRVSLTSVRIGVAR